LWQGRFASFPLDNNHLLASARYIERNPVAAGLIENPWDYPWSSARAHMENRDDILVRVNPLLEMVEDWQEWISWETPKEMIRDLQKHERTGRPLGDDSFIDELEMKTGRELKVKMAGRKKKK
jgi:putative transposase